MGKKMAKALSRGVESWRFAPVGQPATEGEPTGLLENVSFQEHKETSSVFFKNGVRERMKEKKNGVLKTAKMNASLASKIRARTINNSSIIKVSLKQNNKALALALNAAKITAQKLTDDKMLLQKEVELGHFENACLRQKLSSVKKYIDELQLFMNSRFQTAIKLTKFSESDSYSSLLDERGHSDADDISRSQDDSNCPRVAPKSMRIPLSQVDDEESDNGRNTSTNLEIFPLDPLKSAFDKTWRSMPFPEVKKSFSYFTDKLSASSGNSDPRLHGVDVSTLAFNSNTIFGDNLWNVPQNSRSCSISVLDNNYPVQQCEETARPHSDSILFEHVTKRKKCKTGFPVIFGNNLEAEVSDTDKLQLTKETESLVKENLEISHVGELITLSTKSESCIKIKAKETKTLENDNAETKNTMFSTNQSNLSLNNGNNRRSDVAMSKTGELNSSKIKLPKSACHVGSSDHDKKEKCSSQHLGQTTRNRRTYVVEPSRVNNYTTQEIEKGIFLEKMKNLENQSQCSESRSLSNEIQQNEKSCSYSTKSFNKTKNCKRTIVLDPGSSNDRNDCTSQHDIKKKTDLENLDSLGRQVQSPEFNSLNIVNTFGNNLETEVSDIDKLQVTKETESLVKENLEISHVGELITLSTKSESCIKIKAKETKTLENDNAETKNTMFSTNQSKLSLNNGNNQRPDVAMSKTSELNSSKIKLPKSACHVGNSDHDRKEKCSSQHLGQTTRNRRTFVVEPSRVNNYTTQEIEKGIFLEKMKNLENQSQCSESRSLSNEIQQNEKSCRYSTKCLNKTKNCRRTIVLDPGSSSDRNGCTSQHDIKKTTYLENLDSLGRQVQSPESNSLNIVNTECSVGFKKQVPSQEAISGLNVKRKSKRKVHESNGSHRLSEMEEQSLDNIDYELPQSEIKKKKHGNKTISFDRDIIQKEHSNANADVFVLNEKPQKVSKKKRRKSKCTPSVLSIYLGDEDNFFERSNSSVKKNWETSTIPNSCSLTKNSSHLEKANWTTIRNEAGLKKKMSTFTNKTCSVNDLGNNGTDSEPFLQGPEECEITQTNQTKWSFLQVTDCRALQKPIVDITKTLSLNPDSLSVGLSKNSRYVGVQESPERDCALSIISDVFKENIKQLEISGREEKQPMQATAETSSENAALQENGNKVLKDLANSIPLETSPICPRQRRKKDVSYVEPSLNRKLRRGDPFTITDFLSSPIYKTKRKKLTKGTEMSRKTKNIKKEIQPRFSD